MSETDTQALKLPLKEDSSVAQHRRNLEVHSVGFIGQAALDGKKPVKVANQIRSALDALLGQTEDAA